MKDALLIKKKFALLSESFKFYHGSDRPLVLRMSILFQCGLIILALYLLDLTLTRV